MRGVEGGAGITTGKEETEEKEMGGVKGD